MSKKFWLIMALAIIVMGCATAGRKYDTGAIDRIDVGKTTEGEVVAMLGTPDSITRCGNGIDIYYYLYAQARPLGFGTTVDKLEVQTYKGVVRDKWQILAEY